MYLKVKVKATALQATYYRCSSAVRQKQLSPLFKSMLTDFGLQPYIALGCRFNGLHIRNRCKD